MKGLLALLALTLLHANVVAEESGGKHVTWNIDSCMSCHKAGEQKEIVSRLTRPCRDLCQSCHPARAGHHPVGISIAEPVRPPLLLTREGTNTCSTCHDVTQPRTDSVPWLSQSLVRRLAGPARTNKTQYLAMRNDRGRLCRNCH